MLPERRLYRSRINGLKLFINPSVFTIHHSLPDKANFTCDFEYTKTPNKVRSFIFTGSITNMESIQFDPQLNKQFVLPNFNQNKLLIENHSLIINSRQSISHILKQAVQFQGDHLVFHVKLNCLPYPYFQQLLKLLKASTAKFKAVAVEVNWYFNPRLIDIWEKGKLMESFCPSIPFYFHRITLAS